MPLFSVRRRRESGRLSRGTRRLGRGLNTSQRGLTNMFLVPGEHKEDFRTSSQGTGGTGRGLNGPSNESLSSRAEARVFTNPLERHDDLTGPSRPRHPKPTRRRGGGYSRIHPPRFSLFSDFEKEGPERPGRPAPNDGAWNQGTQRDRSPRSFSRVAPKSKRAITGISPQERELVTKLARRTGPSLFIRGSVLGAIN